MDVNLPSSAPVQCLDNFDITGDGVRDLLVGRHDGGIEVYAYDEGDDAEPVLKFAHVSIKSHSGFATMNGSVDEMPFTAFLSFQNCGESISSIEGGVIGTPGYEEIIATTYTGE